MSNVPFSDPFQTSIHQRTFTIFLPRHMWKLKSFTVPPNQVTLPQVFVRLSVTTDCQRVL